MEDIDINNFAKEHKVGYCKMPAAFSHLPSLSAPGYFMIPSKVDLRDFCTKTEDQGSKPWCAAYSAAQWAENIIWRLNDRPVDIDPTPIYKHAKEIDGDPNGDGTTLTAVLESLRYLNIFPSNCEVKVLRPNRLSVQYAIHKFGCCLGGFNITSEWYGRNRKDWVIAGNDDLPMIGGHAVLICGYDKEGIWFQNSWGWQQWGEYGFGKMLWKAFDRQFMYGAVLSNCLNGLTLNT